MIEILEVLNNVILGLSERKKLVTIIKGKISETLSMRPSIVKSKDDLLEVKRSLETFKYNVQLPDSQQQQSVCVRKCQALMEKTRKLEMNAEFGNFPCDLISYFLVSRF